MRSPQFVFCFFIALFAVFINFLLVCSFIAALLLHFVISWRLEFLTSYCKTIRLLLMQSLSFELRVYCMSPVIGLKLSKILSHIKIEDSDIRIVKYHICTAWRCFEVQFCKVVLIIKRKFVSQLTN